MLEDYTNTDPVSCREPLKRGAAIDWKETAHVIEQRLIDERKQMSVCRTDLKRCERNASVRLSDAIHILDRLRHKWWFNILASASMVFEIDRVRKVP